LNHYASPDFWSCYRSLPAETRELADKSFSVLKSDPRHPSLHLKKTGRFWSARIGLRYRAVTVDAPDGLLWFCIGSHAEYDKFVSKKY
jgi:hypothetical protein